MRYIYFFSVEKKSLLRELKPTFFFRLSCRTVISDRDSVATSKNFQEYIYKRYGIRWFFLKKLSKSYLSERYIGFVKTRLSMAMSDRESRGLDGRRWTGFLEPLLKEYNNSSIQGTSYTRQSVHKDNFDHFLGQLLDTDQPELLFNSGTVAPFRNESWNRKAFRFTRGQRVLLSKRAEWKARQRYHAFEKYSTQGGFTKTVYTVGNMHLRKVRGLKNFVAVYSLKEYGPNVHFYEAELKGVDETAGSDPSAMTKASS